MGVKITLKREYAGGVYTANHELTFDDTGDSVKVSIVFVSIVVIVVVNVNLLLLLLLLLLLYYGSLCVVCMIVNVVLGHTSGV